MPHDNIFPFFGIAQALREGQEAIIRYYSLSFVFSGFGILWSFIVRRRRRRLPEKLSRSRLVWFIPVLFGGIQSLFHADEARIGDFPGNYQYFVVFIWQDAASAAVALSLILAACMVAETVSGRPKEAQSRWTIPLPIAATILAVALFWAIILFIYTAWVIPPYDT